MAHPLKSPDLPEGEGGHSLIIVTEGSDTKAFNESGTAVKIAIQSGYDISFLQWTKDPILMVPERTNLKNIPIYKKRLSLKCIRKSVS